MNKKRPASRTSDAFAVIRFRQVVVIMAAVAIGVMAPLWMVWKEAYVTRLSMDHTTCADSLALLRRDVERLRLVAQSLSQAARIEEIARQSLGLEYPRSHQIVIVPVSTSARRGLDARWEFFAMLRKSLSKDRG